MRKHTTNHSKLFPVLILSLLVLLFSSTVIKAQKDVQPLKAVIVEIAIEDNPSQSGILVTDKGHILTAASDALLNIQPDTSISIRAFPNGTATDAITLTAHLVEEVGLSAALLQIDASDHSADLKLPYLNVIAQSSEVGFLDTVYGVSYSNIGKQGVVVTENRVNTVRFTAPQDYLPGKYYGTSLTLDFTGLGGLIVSADGNFVGLISTLNPNEQFAEVTTIETICFNDPSICNEILEANRPVPDNRTKPKSGLKQLTNGTGQVDGSRISNGQVQMEYFCKRLGMDTRIDSDQTHYECVDRKDQSTVFVLEAVDHDIICQQTYHNPAAIAFQVKITGISPAQSWRCYG